MKNKTAEDEVPQTSSHQVGKYQGKEERTKTTTTLPPQANASHSLGAAKGSWSTSLMRSD